MLIGRDLSAGGMRVDRQKELAVGARCASRSTTRARETPVVVMARVARDDGERGVALSFEELAPEVAEQLEQLVAGLPPVECLQDGETGAIGTVVSEILG